MSGLPWGYYGEGPSGLHEIMQSIDLSITYKQITKLHWEQMKDPIVFENINGKLFLKSSNQNFKNLISDKDDRLLWENQFPMD